ncbi:MAG: hypothetical protein ACRDX8_11690 [Acidimicrobiales bacterium]
MRPRRLPTPDGSAPAGLVVHDRHVRQQSTTLPPGPATLALRTGAALLPTGVFDLGRGRHLGVMLAPLDVSRTPNPSEDVARVTAELAVALEGLIRRAPEQWHLFQPNWPSDPGWGAIRERGTNRQVGAGLG